MQKPSPYVRLVIIVPETHADLMRDALGKAGIGESNAYSHCSFSVKGTGRFMPKAGASPFIGEEGILETVHEERIETICLEKDLERAIEIIKKTHPYEETIIDIHTIYEIGIKSSNN